MSGQVRHHSGPAFLFLAAVLLAPRLSVAQADPELSLGFEELRCGVAGNPGETRTFTILATLTIKGDQPSISGWQIGLTADGGEIAGIQNQGIILPTSLGDLDLVNAGFNQTELAVHSTDPARKGAVSAVILGLVERRLLPPAGTFPVARLTIESPVPAAADCGAVTLRYEDGFQGSGSSINNRITVVNASAIPAVNSRTIPVCRSDAAPPCEAISLQPGVPVRLLLTESQPSCLYKLAGEAGKSVIITIADDDPGDANAIYAGWEPGILPARFEFAADRRGEANQRLALSLSRTGDLFVLVFATILSGRYNEVELLAELKDGLALEGMTSEIAGTGGSGRISADIIGTGFEAGTTFTLEKSGAGKSLSPIDLEIISPERAQAVFDLAGAPEGTYDLMARNPGGATDILPSAFVIVPGEVGSLLVARLTGNRHYRYNRIARLTLSYSNVGDAEMAAPLFKISAPAGTEMKLERETGFREREILVLGANLDGFPGRLRPGASFEIPILYRSTTCDSCDLEFLLSVFKPTGDDAIDWEGMPKPEGMADADWQTARGQLPDSLGRNWLDFQLALADLSTRLSRRGVHPASVLEPIRYAVRDALGRPNLAITGRVAEIGSGAPLAEKFLHALDGGSVRSSARTNAEGGFALDCLEGDKTYRIVMVDHDIGTVEVLVPAGEDVLGLELAADPMVNGLTPAAPGCNPVGLPTRPIFPPAGLFGAVADLSVRLVSSIDPNEKEGDTGEGDIELNRIRVNDRLYYKILFENLMSSTAAADEVVITDVLDPNLDWTTLVFTEVQLGADSAEKTVLLDGGGADLTGGSTRATTGGESQRLSFSETAKSIEVEDPIAGRSLVDVQVKAELVELPDQTRMLQWDLTSLTSGLVSGFLPPNDCDNTKTPPEPPDCTHRGEGYVSFSVLPRKDLKDGDKIENDAVIKFGARAPIQTRKVVFQIDSFLPPETPRLPQPADGAGGGVALDAQLSWLANRADSFDLYLWRKDQAKPAVPTAKGLTASAFRPSALLANGVIYNWQVVAINANGQAPGPDPWTFQAGALRARGFVRGDANADGLFDISDPVFILGFLFLGEPGPSCMKGADANDDSLVDISDPVFLLEFQFLGGPQPSAPYPACGLDPSLDSLSCESFQQCP